MSKPLRFKYSSFEFGDIDIHLKSLKDKNQFLDNKDTAKDLGISSAQWSLFGVIWDSSIVLAQEMLSQKIKGKTILEVGCGIAMSSHLLSARGADITATDYHPEVGFFLADNIELNNKKEIRFVLEDWNTKDSKLGKFDLIIGSDLLYEPHHSKLLSQFFATHANMKCEIIIVDPNRGHVNKFTREMEELGFIHKSKSSLKEVDFKGIIHSYIKK